MDKIIDSDFDRLEKAMANLVNPIANYTANPQAARDLVKADSLQVDGFRTLHKHQTNHQLKIQKQAYAALLDSKIKDALLLLANTRSELISTPATEFSDENKRWPIQYDELLAYARRISAFTIPPGGYSKGVENSTLGSAVVESRTTPERSSEERSDAARASTPASAQESNTNGNGVTNANATSEANGTALPEDWTTYLHPQANMAWLPWPSDEHLRMGTLNGFQFAEAAAAGGDTLMAEADDPDRAERERAEEESRMKEEMVRREVERARGVAAAGSGNESRAQQEQQQAPQQSGGGPRAQQFAGLGLLDDDDED